jgi:hypothetical protein
MGSGLGNLVGSFTNSLDLGKLMGGSQTSEDCLFLDLYVPSKALKGGVKLPVINWIYGGAYILGTKDGMYDGTGIIRSAGGDAIFVAGNYRVSKLLSKEECLLTTQSLARLGFWVERQWRRTLRARRTLASGINGQYSSGFTTTRRSSGVTQMMSVSGANLPEV